MTKPICYSTKAYSTVAANAPLGATTIERRQPTPTDVQIQILYCGVCHSDLHFARNEWHFTQYPAVPGYLLFRESSSDITMSLCKINHR